MYNSVVMCGCEFGDERDLTAYPMKFYLQPKRAESVSTTSLHCDHVYSTY